MEDHIYEASTIEECVQLACQDLNLSSEELEYEVIDKKGFFKKKSRIKVLSIKNDDLNFKVDNKDGVIYIKDGIIKVINPIEGGKKAQINFSDNIEIYVDGQRVNSSVYVDESNTIEYKFLEEESKRIFNIITKEDRMEAYGKIEMKPKRVFKLADVPESNVVELKLEIIKEENPPAFTEQEIIQALEGAGIKFGIINDGIANLTKKVDLGEVLLAKGIEVENGIDDKIVIYFKDVDERVYSDKDNIDFRNWSNIKMVKSGELLAEIVLGKEGHDGTDVFGKTLPCKKYKTISVSASDGCVQENNKFYSTLDGKPYYRGNSIGVNRSYEVNSDVDMSTGNLDFVGDIKIAGNIGVGMLVKAGGEIYIEGGTDRANIQAGHNIIIKGNALNSTIETGKEDVYKKLNIDLLNSLRQQIANLKNTAVEVQTHHLLGNNRSNGEVIKVLIENKFKLISKYSLELLENDVNKEKKDELSLAIREYLLGVGPLSIKDFSVLDDIIKLIDDKLVHYSESIEEDREVFVSYCQECNIYSSGNVYFTGKGQYLSEVVSNKGIYFKEGKSIARGGLLKAETEIKCNVVGSTGGVKTKLAVGKKGHIYVDIAYHNTLFSIGLREYLLEEPSRNIHVHLDESGDIVVDKLRL